MYAYSTMFTIMNLIFEVSVDINDFESFVDISFNMIGEIYRHLVARCRIENKPNDR